MAPLPREEQGGHADLRRFIPAREADDLGRDLDGQPKLVVTAGTRHDPQRSLPTCSSPGKGVVRRLPRTTGDVERKLEQGWRHFERIVALCKKGMSVSQGGPRQPSG